MKLTPLGALLILFSTCFGEGGTPLQASREAGPAPSSAFDRAAREKWAAAETELQSVSLPQGRPALFEATLTRNGAPLRIALRRHSVRAAGATLRVHLPERDRSSSRSWREEPLPPPATYRGSVVGVPGSVVLASLQSGGLSADILLPGDQRWSVRPVSEIDSSAARALHAVFDETHDHWRVPACGVGDEYRAPNAATQPLVTQPGPACLKLAEIAFDADFEYFQSKGSSVSAVVDAIDAIMNQVDFYYARDVLITYRTTGYVVRTAPFYTPTSGGDLLDLFEAEWTANQAGIQRDLTHLMTAKSGALIQFGGLGQVGVVCNPGYAWSMDGANIVGHEVGHNWGAGHCHDPTPCNNMCGSCFLIGPNTKDIITAFRDSRVCLEPAGPYPTPLPPYAHPERIKLRKDQLDGIGSVVIDVLKNDHDANCEPFFLQSFEERGSRGGLLSRSLQTGPGGRDQLVYTPPVQPFVGEESFRYTIGDGTLLTQGVVTVEIESVDLVANWRLDEASGTSVNDATPGRRHGTILGTPARVAGVFGGALDFDGQDDSVLLPALDLNDDSVTLATWFRRNGPQEDQAGLVFSRGGMTVAGLHLRSSGDLGATWNRTVWNPGVATPNQQWVFGAMVIEPTRETLYLYDGVLSSATQLVTNELEEFGGELRLALDDFVLANRYFAGALDEVRVYDYALDASEISDLALSGGRAGAPEPRDGGPAATPTESLSWVGSPLADSFDVYFGTDYLAVRDATTASAEFQGNTPQTSFSPAPFLPGTTYHWRVDEHIGSELLRGHLWQFSLADYRHWQLDELSGSTAFAAQGSEDGSYVGGTLGQPAASPSLGTSVYFDGADDRVEIPALNLDSNQVTFSAWLRRDGAQKVKAGILASRDADTLAGIHLEGSQELRYHWNDDPTTWDWSSGLLVPDDEWVFVALVVEPDRATLHLGRAGVLSSATHVIPHAKESFGDLLYLAHDPISTSRQRFKGHLDDVRVYSASLSVGQIDALYQATR